MRLALARRVAHDGCMASAFLTPQTDPPLQPGGNTRRAERLLGPMRIRKKLIVLHTTFSLVLAAILLLSVRPAIRDVVARAEGDACRLAVRMLAASPGLEPGTSVDGVELRIGTADEVGGDADALDRARNIPGQTVVTSAPGEAPRAVMYDGARGVFLSAAVQSAHARQAVVRLYALVVAAIVGVYLLIALTLEAFVLPRQVYRPIRRLLAADEAVQSGDRDNELIEERAIPRDELGEIMRSRNESIVKLRRQESALNAALEQLETVATDLKRKNHLIETAKRNMADQDRLASLGVMSAGIAHELNTPLAVLKGCVETLAANPRAGVDPERAGLMLRVVKRLERLSESLLDFARVRPPTEAPVDLPQVVDEAWTLVRLDREAAGVEFEARFGSDRVVTGDADRLTQVFVNLIRNAVDAVSGAGVAKGRVTVSAERSTREGREWLSVTVADNGPGIDPGVMARMFEPFTSTRLDARGTGLGLAVAEGIVREHGGVVLARNAHAGGAVFEVMLPLESPAGALVEGGGMPGGTWSGPDAADERQAQR